MIKIDNVEVVGWEHAIRGMRNPMNSWDKSDSHPCSFGNCPGCTYFRESNFINGDFEKMCARPNLEPHYMIGPNDHELMMKLAKAGPVHAKYRRMIVVYLDIVAPSYWWKEYDTYKVGTVANSTSTMHKIHSKEFTMEDFSCEHLSPPAMANLKSVIKCMNDYREEFLKDHDKHNWWQMIQLLPFSYHYTRTVMLNYEVLASIYRDRKNHKLDEWVEFCEWIETLPYSEIITGEDKQI